MHLFGAKTTMLHSRLLIYLDTVARCGSIRKAGEHLNVASTAINRQILTLEDNLGTPIFQRLPRKLVLTAAGEILLAHVRDTLKNMNLTRQVLEDLKGLKRGEFSIATMVGPISTFLPLALADFHNTHQNVRIHVSTYGTHDLVETVKNGQADIGIGFDIPMDNSLVVQTARTVPLGVVMSVHHPLAHQESITLEECNAWPLTVADDSMAIRPHLEDLYAARDLSLTPAIETNSIELMRQMALSPGNITFLTPLDIIQERAEGKLKFLSLNEQGTQPQTLSIVARSKISNPFTALFIERVEYFLQDYTSTYPV
ncbi:LysR family transcriptional regulator [Gluconobacter cerinus]|nr:LysR family transcriptional regulator [Gluconobacter cerinus]MBS1018998.1 LysR family transcriptional regulator [Gluconobacter cerinus]MBS1022433.1 LysR family transcriptional regulator [Gluconobacter cerinus]MBS1023605.1 LysR family transcriptional regulator [Gluconobacter cerinus]MBS1031175.1 LysR family transcriptional regulator [Gluconobacter cerinus]